MLFWRRSDRRPLTDKERIPVFAPIIGAEETKYVNECLATNWVSQGRYVREFEDAFSTYCGAQCGVAASNCTAALHMAGLALGIGDGDEVLVSSSTNMASAFSMYYCGAKPVPVDIERDTWQMDPADIEPRITERTKAIVVVHLFGHPVDMDPVLEIAQRHKLAVIEDCAQAHGAEYKGRRVGAIGDIGCFSFYSNKIITCGEGGMAVTNSQVLANRLRDFGNFCYGKKQKFQHEDIGFNYRLPNISAAMGLGQFRRIEPILARKREIHDIYSERLREISGLRLPVERPWAKSVLWMFNASLDPALGLSLEDFISGMEERNIEVREAFVPINRQKVFLERGWVREDECPIANEISETGFYLPSGLRLTRQQLDRVCDAVEDVLKTGLAGGC
jgi:perosamine synthetase